MNVILTGILSSIIASVVYALLSFGIKPRIKISEKICITQNKDGTFTYKVKFVNCSRVPLVNVSYHLDYGRYGRDDISYVTEILPNKPPISTITRKNKKNTDYAIRVTYVVDSNMYPCVENSYFEFKIQATHPFSNSVVYKEKRYTVDNLSENCKFQTGENMDVLELSDYSIRNNSITKAPTPAQ